MLHQYVILDSIQALQHLCKTAAYASTVAFYVTDFYIKIALHGNYNY